MIIKLGESHNVSGILQPKEVFGDKKIAARFVKLAKKLKRIAPKANDFLYGHAIMMHAAEASLVDQKTGEPILDKNGNPVVGKFEPIKLKNGKESVKWQCSKDGLMPYKNANGDIFPEAELIKAHKEWVGKPLCKDHKSESVDGIRGIIIDTHYDPKFKRVHALFALDRKNYGDLARKVETGYANAVSMGTAVGRSVCTECANPATVEREYCPCIRSKKNFGEINLDLKPIELSLVVNGADGLAKIKNIIASYVEEKQSRIKELTASKCVNPAELHDLADSLNDMQKKLSSLINIEKTAEVDLSEKSKSELIGMINALEGDDEATEEISKLRAELRKRLGEEGKEPIDKSWPPARPGAGGPTVSPMAGGAGEKPSATTINGFSEGVRLASKEGDKQGTFSNELRLLRSKIEAMQKSLNTLNKKVSKEENNMNSARLRARAKARRAYWLGGGGVNEPTPGKPKYEKEEADKIRDTEDKHMVGTVEMGSDGLYPGDAEKKKEYNRDGLNLSKAELKDRAMKRRAYWLGGGGINEPSPGKYPYEKDPMAEKVRDNEDKHLQGIYDMGGKDGTVPGDMEVKKKLLRAKLRAKFVKVADTEGKLNKKASHWDVYAGDKMILTASGDEIYGDELDKRWDYLSSREYGSDVIKLIREEGFDRLAYLLKGAQPPADPAGGMELPPLPEEGAAPPAPEGGEAPMPEAPPAEEPKEEEGVKGKVDAALGKMEEQIEAIRAAVTEGGEKLVDIEVKVDDDGKGEGAAPTPVEEVTASQKAAIEIHALMNDAADELALISEALEGETNDKILVAAGQALADSEAILAEAALVVESAKKDKKDDDKEDKDEKKDEKEDEDDADDGTTKTAKKKAPKCEKCDKPFFQCECKKDKKDDDKEDKDEKKDDKEKKAEKMLEDALRLRAENRAAMLKKMAENDVENFKEFKEFQKAIQPADTGDLDPGVMADGPDFDLAMDALMADDKDDEEDEEKEKEDKKEKDDDDKEEKEDDAVDCCGDAQFVEEPMESVMAARKKAREELVAQAADKILDKYELDLGTAQNATEPKYFEAHPGGKGTTTDLSHTKTDEAKVETISEIHDVMRDVAESGPRNVREAAMEIQEGIVKGAFKAEDLDALVKAGKVDAAAAAYWKKYWAQGSDTGSFGADLSKEFASKKKEASAKELEVKMRRAYDTGLQAQEKGLIDASRDSLDKYVDEIMQLDDAAFESTKRIIASMNGNRKNKSLPRVGVDAAAESMTVTASIEKTPDVDWTTKLKELGWK